MIDIDSHILNPDTQAILLLCSRLEQKYNSQPKPLNINEYNAIATWLKNEELTPADLFDSNLQKRLSEIKIENLDSERLLALLERGMMLSLSVEKWTNQGLWIIARSDQKYPQYLKKNLRFKAPPIIYGVGDIELLNKGGLAIVGSRDIDDEAVESTQRIVELCATQQMQVISGGAKGVDQVSMLGCLNAGGSAIGVLADSLIKASVSAKYRDAIKQNRLTLISTYHPDAGFSVGNAMGRNKYVYALADYALVISSSVGKGGTWAGAVEALDKIKTIPVFVRNEGDVPSGNLKLLEKGAIAFPESPWQKPFSQLLPECIAENKSKPTSITVTNNVQNQNSLPLFEFSNIESESLVEKVNTEDSNSELKGKNIEVDNSSEIKTDFINESNCPSPIDDKNKVYNAVLPLILKELTIPKTDKSLAEDLDVQVGQIRAWLKIAVKQGKVIKNKNPVTYESNNNKNSLTNK